MNLIGDLAGPFALLMGNFRSIGFIIPDVTIEEIHIDTMQITDHPVEIGAAISDHAFMQPVEVQMTVGWSNSVGGFPFYSRLIYDALRGLQQAREPFSVATGKRFYQNMLIRNLIVQTDPESENALMVIASLREVLITNTQTSGSVPQGSMTNPAQTAPQMNLGSISSPLYSGSLPVFAQTGGAMVG